MYILVMKEEKRFCTISILPSSRVKLMHWLVRPAAEKRPRHLYWQDYMIPSAVRSFSMAETYVLTNPESAQRRLVLFCRNPSFLQEPYGIIFYMGMKSLPVFQKRSWKK